MLQLLRCICKKGGRQGSKAEPAAKRNLLDGISKINARTNKAILVAQGVASPEMVGAKRA